MVPNVLGNTPLRAADIELILHRFGGEQWSAHFTFSQSQFHLRLPNVRVQICRLLCAGAPISVVLTWMLREFLK